MVRYSLPVMTVVKKKMTIQNAFYNVANSLQTTKHTGNIYIMLQLYILLTALALNIKT